MSAALDIAASEAAPPRRTPCNSIFGPERRALVEAEYACAADTRDLLARVNALPGHRAVSLDELHRAASRFGLKRREARGGGRPPTPWPVPAVPHDPVTADAATIAGWAMANTPKGEAPPARLSAINARRIALGLNPFILDRRRP